MNVVRQPPEKRIPGLRLDRDSNELFIVNLPKYCCPECEEFTVFSLEKARHTNDSESSFTEEELRHFNLASGAPVGWESVHCDFHCRICETPVRVVCRMDEFAMGSWRYAASNVFETCSAG